MAAPTTAAPRTGAGDQLINAAAVSIHQVSRSSVRALVLVIRHAIVIAVERYRCEEVIYDDGMRAPGRRRNANEAHFVHVEIIEVDENRTLSTHLVSVVIFDDLISRPDYAHEHVRDDARREV